MAVDMRGQVLHIEGLHATLRRLEGFEGKALALRVGHVLKPIVRHEMVPAMKGAAPRGKTGRLERAIDIRSLPAKSGELVAFKVGPGGKRGPNKAWYAHMVVGGTKPHLITPRGLAGGRGSPNIFFSRLARSANRPERGAMALAFGGLLVRYVRHPGAHPDDLYIRYGLARVKHVEARLTARLIRMSEQSSPTGGL
jgi:hypothetical protein